MCLNYSAEKINFTFGSENENIFNNAIPKLYDDINFNATLTRSELEHLCFEHVNAAAVCIKKCLESSGVDKSEIAEVFLSGGCSRMSMVRKILEFYFRPDMINDTNTMTSVVRGAAIYAAHLSGDETPLVKDIIMSDVNAVSVGFEGPGGKMVTVIKRNTNIPVAVTYTFTTSADDQSSLSIDLFEGEDSMVKNNRFIRRVDVTGFPLKPLGECLIPIRFCIDENGFCNVKEDDVEIVLKSKEMSTTEDAIRMMAENITHFKKGFAEADLIAAKHKLEQYCHSKKRDISDKQLKENLPPNTREKAENSCQNAINWAKDNKTASNQFSQTHKSKSPLKLIRPTLSSKK